MRHYDNNSCAVIVSSCDAYCDLWLPFFTLFFRYWPDCPYPVYLVSNRKTFADDRVISICVGEDKGWATNMKRALETVLTPLVLYLQDDYFLQSRVNTGYISKLVALADREQISCVRLFPEPPPDLEFEGQCDHNLGRISARALYRTSLQAAVWNTDILRGLLRGGESGWDMEILGTIRSRDITAPFLSVKKPTLNYLYQTAVVKGKWTIEAVRLCRKEGIRIDFSARGVAHGIYVQRLLDELRKRPWAKRIRAISGIGAVASKLFWGLRRLITRIF